MNTVQVITELLNETSQLPMQASKEAGGWDVVATEIIKEAPDFYIVKLGFKLKFPKEYKLLLVPRSSITKTKCIVQNSPGLGDSDFPGEYQLRFRMLPSSVNISTGELNYEEFPFKVGERIGQIYLVKHIETEFIEGKREVLDDPNARNEQGFGSTGK